ncbi:ImuA family protein [Cucumibacter marinus]|uniref:ImuA family protein n=1 Tax=Cucumibacter marinus TaxID=1121252 RepID=UPI00040C7103|nr:inducible mutagenesis protein A [Cucumibacter marinus]
MAARIERQQGNMQEGTPPETGRESRIEALRRHIADRETVLTAPAAALPLGPGDIDRSLPGGGLALGTLHEILPAAWRDIPATLGFGFALAARLLAARPGPVLWVLPTHLSHRHGLLYPPGFAAMGLDPDRIIAVTVKSGQNLLWALEEGLDHPALAGVIGLMPGDDHSYDFTASRRLVLRAHQSGVTALMLRDQPPEGAGEATAALTRWQVGALPSIARPYRNAALPGLGLPRWRIELIKCKQGAPGGWEVTWDHETLSLSLSAPLANREAPQTPAAAFGRWRGATGPDRHHPARPAAYGDQPQRAQRGAQRRHATG